MGSDLYAGYRQAAPLRLFDQTKQIETPMPGSRSLHDQESNELSQSAVTMPSDSPEIQESRAET
jgi:hypothetical protein